MSNANTPPVFAQTSRFKECVELINSIDKQKLPLVVSRILEKLSQKSGEVFTDKEEEQLKQLLSISAEQLNTLVSGCSYILDKAAYHNLTGEKLMGHLQSAAMDSDQVRLSEHDMKYL